jgi:hypothetical protein
MRLVLSLVCVIVLVLGGCDTSSDEAAEKSTSSIGAATAVRPSMSVADLVWERSDNPVEGIMRSVVAGGPGLIAVGTMSDEDYDPAAWVSIDGLTWDSVPVEGTYDSSWESMNSVTAGGPGFVSVGMDTFIDFGRRWEAAVWVSEDGMSWQRVSHPALTESKAQEMWGITRSASDLTAVGFSMEVDLEPDAAVWVSSDGYRWDRTSQDSLTTPSGDWIPDDNDPTVVYGPNGYVATGGDIRDGGHAVWHSTDGRNWEQIPDSSLPKDDSVLLAAIAATDDGYVVVGHRFQPNEDSDVVVWLSEDGFTWTEVAFELDGQQVSGAITTFGDEIVVVGLDVDKRTDIIWYSTDGEDWSTLTSPAFGNANGLPMVAYARNNQIIILGIDERPIIGRP